MNKSLPIILLSLSLSGCQLFTCFESSLDELVKRRVKSIAYQNEFNEYTPSSKDIKIGQLIMSDLTVLRSSNGCFRNLDQVIESNRIDRTGTIDKTFRNTSEIRPQIESFRNYVDIDLGITNDNFSQIRLEIGRLTEKSIPINILTNNAIDDPLELSRCVRDLSDTTISKKLVIGTMSMDELTLSATDRNNTNINLGVEANTKDGVETKTNLDGTVSYINKTKNSIFAIKTLDQNDERYKRIVVDIKNSVKNSILNRVSKLADEASNTIRTIDSLDEEKIVDITNQVVSPLIKDVDKFNAELNSLNTILTSSDTLKALQIKDVDNDITKLIIDIKSKTLKEQGSLNDGDVVKTIKGISWIMDCSNCNRSEAITRIKENFSNSLPTVQNKSNFTQNQRQVLENKSAGTSYEWIRTLIKTLRELQTKLDTITIS